LKTPIAFILFRRPEQTARVWERIRAARPEKLFLIADGPRTPNEEKQCRAARDIVANVDWPCEVQRNFSDTNLQAGVRIASGLHWVFGQTDRAVILEDDCLPHPDFFPYCEHLLERYFDRTDIWHINGFNSLPNPDKRHADVFFSHYANPWGWATWSRAWKHHESDLASWPNWSASGELEKIVRDPVQSTYWRRHFEACHRHGRVDIWDLQWLFTIWLHRGISVTPRLSLIENIGLDSGGTHMEGSHIKASPKGASLPLPLRESGRRVDRTFDRLFFDDYYGGRFSRLPPWHSPRRWRMFLGGLRRSIAMSDPKNAFAPDRPHPHAPENWSRSPTQQTPPFICTVYPAVDVELRPPTYDFGSNQALVGRLHEVYPASFLLAIPGGRLWQKPFEFNFVIAPDGRPLRDMTYRTFDYEKMVSNLRNRKIYPCRPFRLEGTTLDLSCLGDGNNYSHWMFDCLPKLEWLSRLPPSIHIDRILVNLKTPFVIETLGSAGWQENRIVSLEETGPHLRCDLLLASSPVTSAYRPFRVFQAVRRLVTVDGQRGSKRLYLSRADALTRRVRNEDDVLALLKPLGFVAVQLAKMSVQEQASLLASAAWVVGPHGAGFANIAFCGADTKVLEWIPEGYNSLEYWSISCELGLDYARMTFPPLDTAAPKASDYDVDIPRLEQALKEMGM
jgi:hypothetical protein